MGKEKKVKSLLEVSEGIGKLLIWLGLISVFFMAYGLGKRNGFAAIKHRVVEICRSISGYPGVDQIAVPISIDGYAVLVGAHNDRADAYALKKRLTAHRINSLVDRQHGRYFVLVGPYTSQKRAQHAYEMVKRSGFPAQLIFPRKRKY